MTYETLTERLNDRLTITHLRGATATTTDALLLAAYLPTVRGEALELGAGAGTVSLLAATRDRFDRAELWERMPRLAALCRDNVAAADLGHRLRVVEGDLRTLTPGARFASVFANPPYRRAKEGRPADDPLADAARFERAGTLLDFCLAAARTLLPRGYFTVILPKRREEEAYGHLRTAGLYPEESVTVYPYPAGEPKLLLLRARPYPTLCRRCRFTLAATAGGAPTEAAERLYGDGILLTEGEPL